MKQINKNKLKKVFNKYNQKLVKTATELKISVKTLKKLLEGHQISYQLPARNSFNEEYFDQLTPENVYWLGFLATDGNVQKTKYSHYIRISLKSTDIGHLEKFKLAVNFNGKIHSYIRKNDGRAGLKQENYYSVALCLTSKKVFNRLADFNIIPRKTYNLKFPEQLIDHSLLSHFVRGCIDGDGFIAIYDGKITIGFCGTKNFATRIFELIKEKLKISGGMMSACKNKNKNWSFKFRAVQDVDKIIKWLYQDATVYLDRKYEVAKLSSEISAKYKDLNFSKKELEESYRKFGSIKLVAKEFDCQPKTIRRKLKEFNIPYKSTKRNKYNEEFFDLKNDGELNFYWAGYLSGKGYLKFKDDQAQNLVVGESLKKKEHLQLFLKNSDMEINLKPSGNSRVYLKISSHKILQQLARFNIEKGKSEKYVFPDFILQDSNLRHFLRGYLDAKSSLVNNGMLRLTLVDSRENLQLMKDRF